MSIAHKSIRTFLFFILLLVKYHIVKYFCYQKHVSKTCAVSFHWHWLRQLRRIRKSLDDGSAETLVHAFVTSRVDYCSAVYAGAPKTITDKLQRVLNAAARACGQ